MTWEEAMARDMNKTMKIEKDNFVQATEYWRNGMNKYQGGPIEQLARFMREIEKQGKVKNSDIKSYLSPVFLSQMAVSLGLCKRVQDACKTDPSNRCVLVIFRSSVSLQRWLTQKNSATGKNAEAMQIAVTSLDEQPVRSELVDQVRRDPSLFMLGVGHHLGSSDQVSVLASASFKIQEVMTH